MATDKNFMEYVAEQLNRTDNITYKKMFGEYMVYSCFRPIMLVCDNNCFVKILPETARILGEGQETGYPYDGAKLHYLIDIDDREKLYPLISKLTEITPLPKKKLNKKGDLHGQGQ